MDPITITVTVIVDEKRRITVDLPEEVPLGKVNLTIQATTAEDTESGERTHEQIRDKLIAAGLLSSDVRYAPDDAVELSPEERQRLGRLFAPLSEQIIEDREDRV